ncbi:MAG TPA: hypothetical protein VLA48_03550 [Nitrososphaeraceae archaeon]|nr:hypothetical protein [Nitrososphaeraceae archaeon]
MKYLDVTATREISNVNRSIYLFDLYNDDGTFHYSPCLVFENVEFEAVWDNDLYLSKFFRNLKKNKKSARKELKQFCKRNSLVYDDAREDLLDIYQRSKQLKFWKNGK